MNSFSTFDGMMFGKGGKTNANSFSYINGFAKSLTIDFSGSSVTDLSNASASSYAKTACGMNIDNNNTTFARIKYGANYLNTSDFNTGSGSFTFHLKHAARYNTLPPFSFQYPNAIQLSKTTVSAGSSFTATFFSSLNPGTTVPYLITGCTSANLSNASLTGSFTSPYTVITYNFISSQTSTITFNISGGLSVDISVLRYVSTISGILFDVKTNGVDMIDLVNTTQVTPINSTAVDFATGIKGMYKYTVKNNMSASATGITTFMVLKFTSTIVNNVYFFQQCLGSTGGTPGGANLYTNYTTPSHLTIGVNDYATTPGTGAEITINTPYIITLQHGKPSSTTLYELMRINGTTRAESTSNTAAGVPTFYKGTTSYFLFGGITVSDCVILAETIVYDNLLSVYDMSFVEHTLATTYGITI